jgi:hypothetical protein
MSRLCNPEDVRKKLALTLDEASDELLYSYIDDAQIEILGDIAIKVTDETLTGDINGSNTTFETSGTFIADRNFDKTITASDVTLYAWTNEDDPSTKSTIAVSTVYDLYGKIVATTAPPSTIEKVTADYYYYSGPADQTLLSKSCAILAAYYYACAEIALMPKQWMHGAYRFIKTTEYKDLIEEYKVTVIKATSGDGVGSGVSERGEHDAPIFIRGEDQ